MLKMIIKVFGTMALLRQGLNAEPALAFNQAATFPPNDAPSTQTDYDKIAALMDNPAPHLVAQGINLVLANKENNQEYKAEKRLKPLKGVGQRDSDGKLIAHFPDLFTVADAQELANYQATIKDVNQDGFKDLFFGPTKERQPYVVMGREGVIFSEEDIDQDGFLRISGANRGDPVDEDALHNLGSVSTVPMSVGDINDDGFEDLLIGAPSGTGSSYVLFGTEQFHPTIHLGDLNGVYSIQLSEDPAETKPYLKPARDRSLNHDKIAFKLLETSPAKGPEEEDSDLHIVSLPEEDASYEQNLNGLLSALFPESGLRPDDHAVDAEEPLTITVPAAHKNFVIEDVNRDGIPDLILGTRATNNNAFVVLGREGSFTEEDLNQDGVKDLLIKTPKGSVYGIFSHSSSTESSSTVLRSNFFGACISSAAGLFIFGCKAYQGHKEYLQKEADLQKANETAASETNAVATTTPRVS